MRHERTFRIHLSFLHESGCGLPFFTNLYSSLRNLATGCCFWQLFPTEVHQTLLDLILVHLPFFQTLLHHCTWLKFVKSELPHAANMRLHNYYPAPTSSLSSGLCFQVFAFYAAYVCSIYCALWVPPESASKLPVSWFIAFFSCHRLSILPALIRAHSKHSGKVPTQGTFPCHYRSFSVCCLYMAAQQWRRAVLTKSSRCAQISGVRITYYLCSYQAHDLTCILPIILQAPTVCK